MNDRVDPPDDEIISNLKKGNEAGFSNLLRKYGPLIQKTAAIKCGLPVEDIEELIPDVVLEIARKIDSYDSKKGSFPAWIKMISHRRGIDQFNLNEKRNIESQKDDTEWEQIDHGEQLKRAACSTQLDEQTKNRIADTLNQMTDREIQLLQLRADDHSNDEIAEWFGLDKGAVATAYCRAREKFRKLFGD